MIADLFFFTRYASAIGYNQVSVELFNNDSRKTIRDIESSADFDHWNYTSTEIIKQHFTDLYIKKPKKYDHGNRR